MSITHPFHLTIVDSSGTEVPYSPDRPFYEPSVLHITLEDMFLGTSKTVKFRLYNDIPDSLDIYDIFEVRFDLSEAYTFTEDVRYDTLYDNSLRKFIKIFIQPGTIDSDIVSTNNNEISSVFHNNLDDSKIGILFIRNPSIYQNLLSLPQFADKYVLIPYFPNPGHYVSFAVGLVIPSKLEEHFLEKALGFPIKQSAYKSPVTAADLLLSVKNLQKDVIVSNNTQQSILLDSVGTYDSAVWGVNYVPFYPGMLARIANRNASYQEAGYDFFSNVTLAPIFSNVPLTHAYFTNGSGNSYYEIGFPDKIQATTTSIVLIPSGTAKDSNKYLEELALVLFEIWLMYSELGGLPPATYNDYVSKLSDVISNHLTTISSRSTIETAIGLQYSQQTGYSSIPTNASFERANILASISLLSSFVNSLATAFPALNIPAVLYQEYIPKECLAPYFNAGTEDDYSACDFESYTEKSFWSTPPSLLSSPVGIQKLHYLKSTLFIASLLKSLSSILLASDNISTIEKNTLQSELDSYFAPLSYNLGVYGSKHIAPFMRIINERYENGSANEFYPPFNTILGLEHVFTMHSILASAGIVTEFSDSISRQFWTYIQKYYWHRGVYTELPPMLLTHTQPAAHISDNIAAVLSDIDMEKFALNSIFSHAIKTESEKLISLKTEVRTII